jgi:hypothetical protein
VYQLSGRQLIAGMSYLGEWEQRCFDLFEEAKKERAILWITDLAVFGRTGRSRQSDRSLADVFRAPIARGELTVIADLTPAELARLEQDAPELAALFTPLRLPPASREDALRMLLSEARRIERERPKTFLPEALISVLELASTLVAPFVREPPVRRDAQAGEYRYQQVLEPVHHQHIRHGPAEAQYAIERNRIRDQHRGDGSGALDRTGRRGFACGRQWRLHRDLPYAAHASSHDAAATGRDDCAFPARTHPLPSRPCRTHR